MNAPTIERLSLKHLHPSPSNPKHRWEKPDLELAASIKMYGVLAPLLVRPLKSGGWEIVAGHRRFAAARAAGHTDVPAIVQPWSDAGAASTQLVENLHREDLGPIEQASLYAAYLGAARGTQAELAAAIGKTETHVSQMLSLLQLPAPAKRLVATGELTFAHGRELARLMVNPLTGGDGAAHVQAAVREMAFGGGDYGPSSEAKFIVDRILGTMRERDKRAQEVEAARKKAATERARQKADTKAQAREAKARARAQTEAAKGAAVAERESAIEERVIPELLAARAPALAKDVAASRKQLRLPAGALPLVAEWAEFATDNWGMGEAGTQRQERVAHAVLPRLPGTWGKGGLYPRPKNDAARLSFLAFCLWLETRTGKLDDDLERAAEAELQRREKAEAAKARVSARKVAPARKGGRK